MSLDLADTASHSSKGDDELADWDVIDATNEMEQLNKHFEQGEVGASLYMDACVPAIPPPDIPASLPEDIELIQSLTARNTRLLSKVAELEHELHYADKARLEAEERNAHLCITNSSLTEEVHSLTAMVSKLHTELLGMENEKKNLEKSTVQLENFVEETISNSQSGYNFLCETRERVTDITKQLMGLRNFLNGHSSSSVIMDESAVGFKGGALAAIMADLNVTFGIYKEAFSEVSLEVRRLKSSTSLETVTTEPSQPQAQISLASFNQGDIAMFFPTPKGDYVAFNIGAPHHYLSEESKALIGHDPHFKKVYVLGRVIMKEKKISDPSNSPYHLKPGTVYYEISVESISDLFPAPAMKGSNHRFKESKISSTKS